MKIIQTLRILIFVFITFLGSCKKLFVDKAPDSLLSDKLVGSYVMTEIISGGKSINLPYKQGGDELNGAIEIERSTEVQIEVNYTLNTIIKGVKESDTVSDVFFVKQVSKDIELFEDEKFTKQVGSLAEGKTLYIVSGDTDRITAIKK
jgi:hypothetical protein